MTAVPPQLRRFSPAIILFVLGAVAACILMNREWSQMMWQIPGTPNEYPLAQLLRPWFISIGCFLPALAALIYAFCDIMDRYITRLFLSSFFMCTAILSIIFILGDFTENASDLSSFDNPLLGTLRFYLMQMPMVLNLILPYTLLLGVLWTLTKLSSSSELTGMLQSGRSLMRLTAPILICSGFVSIYFGIFGFHWAPNATLSRKLLFASMSDSRKLDEDPNAQAIRYRNDSDNRIWNIRIPPSIDMPGAPLQDVHIEQFSSPGQIGYELFAAWASWDRVERVWTFHRAIRRIHPPKENLTSIPVFDPSVSDTIKMDFEETPGELISQTRRPDAQGTPEIVNQLKNSALNDKLSRSLKTEMHVRFARVFSCIILAFIAIPSAITFQRRSPMAGVGIAIFLAAAMLFLYEFFPTLASAGYLPIWLGAWLPNIIYACIAAWLYQTRLAMRTPLEWFKMRREEARILASTGKE